MYKLTNLITNHLDLQYNFLKIQIIRINIISNGKMQHHILSKWCGLNNKNTWKENAYNFLNFFYNTNYY